MKQMKQDHDDLALALTASSPQPAIRGQQSGSREHSQSRQHQRERCKQKCGLPEHRQRRQEVDSVATKFSQRSGGRPCRPPQVGECNVTTTASLPPLTTFPSANGSTGFVQLFLLHRSKLLQESHPAPHSMTYLNSSGSKVSIVGSAASPPSRLTSGLTSVRQRMVGNHKKSLLLLLGPSSAYSRLM